MPTDAAIRLQEIIVVPHSHTDLGFTHDQPVVDVLHGRYLDYAMDLVEAHASAPHAGERYHWTVEVCGVLDPWLRRASPAAIARLQRLEAAGLVEVAALPYHLTPLADATDWRAAFDQVRRLHEYYGLRLTSALSSDVNGQNWPLVDVMLDYGVTGYSAAINTHFGRAPFTRPTLFEWEAPSGRTIPAFNGFPYGFPAKLGLADSTGDRFAGVWLPRLEAHLAAVNWPLPVIMLQSVHPFGDNAGPDLGTLRFVRQWNAAGRRPRLTMGTPRTWWQAVRGLSPTLGVARGDWTDFWNFGCLSTARDLAAHRRARVVLRQADVVADMLPAVGAAEPPLHGELRDRAWDRHVRWMEHTWTADCGAEAPHAEDVAAQSAHKAALVYESRSLGLLLRRDAMLGLAQHLPPPPNADDLLVVNPLPWPRTISGLVAPGVSFRRGVAGDPLAGAHFQDRKADLDPLDMAEVPDMPWKQYPEHALLPVDLPAHGWRYVPRTRLAAYRQVERLADDGVVVAAHCELVYDRATGAIRGVTDRRTARQWLAGDGDWSFGQWVHETLAPPAAGDGRWARDRIFHMDWGADALEIPSGWQTDWPAVRRSHDGLTSQQAVRSALGTHLIQWFRVGMRAHGLRYEWFMPHHAPWLECRARWLMEPDPEPQAHYLVFPFALDAATPRVDLGGAVMRPGVDQLAGCCHDYFTAQNWVDLSAADCGVTVALPENPMVQFGDFQFGKARPSFVCGAPTVLGWVTANYWHCNFPASQPGWVKARYRLQFHAGFDEQAAHRFGADAAEDRPLVHAVGPSRQ
jgi:alpha-mannosidase